MAAAPVVPAVQQAVPQLTRDAAAPAVLARAQDRQQQLMRPNARPSRRLRPRRARAGHLDQGPHQVDAGLVRVGRLDQPRVDVDEHRPGRAIDHVG